MKSDKYASYAMLVEKVSRNEQDAEDYIIGGVSQNGNFKSDAKEIKEEKGFKRIIHAKLYLCGLMYETPVTKEKAERAIERIEPINETNLDPISEQVLEQLD
jgi:hypothetical protein